MQGSAELFSHFRPWDSDYVVLPRLGLRAVFRETSLAAAIFIEESSACLRATAKSWHSGRIVETHRSLKLLDAHGTLLLPQTGEL